MADCFNVLPRDVAGRFNTKDRSPFRLRFKLG